MNTPDTVLEHTEIPMAGNGTVSGEHSSPSPEATTQPLQPRLVPLVKNAIPQFQQQFVLLHTLDTTMENMIKRELKWYLVQSLL